MITSMILEQELRDLGWQFGVWLCNHSHFPWSWQHTANCTPLYNYLAPANKKHIKDDLIIIHFLCGGGRSKGQKRELINLKDKYESLDFV